MAQGKRHAVGSKKDAEIRPASQPATVREQQHYQHTRSKGDSNQARSVFPQIASCPRMADDTAIVRSNENDASTPVPSPCFVDFVEFPIQCKSEPCTSLTSSTEEDPLVFVSRDEGFS